MKMRLLMGLSVALGLMAVLGGSSGVEASDFECTGVVGGTIENNLVVPSGAVCHLAAANVRGNVLVRPEGALQTSANTVVRGNILAERPKWIGIGYPFPPPGRGLVTGNIEVKQTIEEPPLVVGDFNFVCDMEVRGDIKVSESSKDAAWDIGDARSCNAESNLVGGNVIAEKNQARLRISDNQLMLMPGAFALRGDVQFIENASDGGGSSGGSHEINNNRIRSDLQVFKNTDGVTVMMNTVRRNLQCKDNNPVVTPTLNTVGGNTECPG